MGRLLIITASTPADTSPSPADTSSPDTQYCPPIHQNTYRCQENVLAAHYSWPTSAHGRAVHGNAGAGLGVYAELLLARHSLSEGGADTEFQKVGKGKLAKAKASGVVLGAFGFAGQGRPWRKQRARTSPMPIASEGNDAHRGITSAASAVVFI
jgi:hypothetical protein